MILELKDDEILDFLMTSDLEENYSTEELKYLIFKWRYFYRTVYNQGIRNKEDYEFEIKNLKSKIDSCELEKNQILAQKAQIENNLNSVKTRHLSWKERFKGKIIIDENENI